MQILLTFAGQQNVSPLIEQPIPKPLWSCGGGEMKPIVFVFTQKAMTPWFGDHGFRLSEFHVVVVSTGYGLVRATLTVKSFIGFCFRPVGMSLTYSMRVTCPG